MMALERSSVEAKAVLYKDKCDSGAATKSRNALDGLRVT